jgi:hypothetical protein
MNIWLVILATLMIGLQITTIIDFLKNYTPLETAFAALLIYGPFWFLVYMSGIFSLI